MKRNMLIINPEYVSPNELAHRLRAMAVLDIVMNPSEDSWLRLVQKDPLEEAYYVRNGAGDEMDIRPANPDKPVGLMSGGNQQKVVLGKWLMRDLKVLIVDEPTAGIDVGAKDEIYRILEELAKKGVVVILVSSDLQELIRVSHRILVMRKGAIVREFDQGMVTQSMILEAASGLTGKERSM